MSLQGNFTVIMSQDWHSFKITPLFNRTQVNETEDDDTYVIDETKAKLQLSVSIALMIVVIVIMLALGCTVELKILIQNFKRPFPLILGLFAQFLLLPALCFGTARVFTFDQYEALGLLVVGTSPGGTYSNLYTYWIKGDVVLSVCMTSVSTAAAIGMMPLNLWLYSRFFLLDQLFVPYDKICIGLATLLVPTAIGMLILRKAPTIAMRITKVGTIVSTLLVVYAVIICMYLYVEKILLKRKSTFIATIALPLIGMISGYICTRLACRSHKQSKTVAIEVSSQNFTVAVSVLNISLQTDTVNRVILVPIMYGLFALIEFCLICLLYNVFLLCFKRPESNARRKDAETYHDEEIEVLPVIN